MARPRKASKKNILDSASSYLDKIEAEVQSNQSRVSLILGVLIAIFAGILLFNYFERNKPEVGPSQQTEQTQDVSPEKLPGSYMVKEGDTLFSIAEKYYQDGFKYPEIAKANNLINVDSINAGQVLQIPKVDSEAAETPKPTEQPPTPTPTPTPSETTQPVVTQPPATIWGPVITEDTYTVVEGDWLSKIAGRAYNGDIMAYKKLAEVNKIANPDLIFPGQVIIIPR